VELYQLSLIYVISKKLKESEKARDAKTFEKVYNDKLRQVTRVTANTENANTLGR